MATSVALLVGVLATGGRVGGGRGVSRGGPGSGPNVAGKWLASWGVPIVVGRIVALPWEAVGLRIGRVGEYTKLGCWWSCVPLPRVWGGSTWFR